MKAQHPPKRPDRRRVGLRKKVQRPPHPGEAETIAARRVLALELRKGGLVYRDIAAKLGVDVRTAWADVNAELVALRDQAHQDAQDVRNLELERCDAMTQGLWAGVQSGNSKAVMAAVRVSERRARLIGLDAPEKREHSGSIGSDPEHMRQLALEMTDDELKTVTRLYAEIRVIENEARRRLDAYIAVHGPRK